MKKNIGKTVLILGIGAIGGWVLEFLARHENVESIISADINEDYGYRKVENVSIGSAHEGYFKKIEFRKLNLFDIEKTSELIKELNPDVIYNSITLPVNLGNALMLPSNLAKQWIEHYAITYPVSLVPTIKLMRAIKKAKINTCVVNNSFPDLVNYILKLMNLDCIPLIGAGNIDNRVGEIKRRISIEKNISIEYISIWMVAEHAIMARGSHAPFYIKIVSNGNDITKEIEKQMDITALLSRYITYNTKERITLGLPHMASSAVKHIMAVLNDTNELSHSPGPNGLPGGYPVRINAKGAEVELPSDLSIQDALKINIDGLKLEGVDRVNPDGTVVFTEEGYNAMKVIFGIDLKKININDCEQIAYDLVLANDKLIKKYSGYKVETIMR